MPRRHKPRTGYFGYATYDDVEAVEYPPETLEEFRTQFNLEDENFTVFSEMLSEAAVGYRWQHKNFDIAPRKGEVKAALTPVIKNARRLQQSLDDMDQVSRKRFWDQFSDAEQFLVKHGNNDLDNWRDVCAIQGNEWRVRKLRSDGHAVDRLHWIDLEQALRVIERCADYALRKYDADEPADRGGPRKHQALDQWLIDLGTIWSTHSPSPFTIDFHGDKPLSGAAQFCVKAVQAVEPEIPPKSIRIAAKRAVKQKLGRGV